jgi:transcriptional regulator with XRE-family HTH domain
METKTIHDDAYKLLIVWIVQERKKKGLSQGEFAEKLSISQRKMSRIETIERRVDVVELWHICTALEIDFIGMMQKLEIVLKSLK